MQGQKYNQINSSKVELKKQFPFGKSPPILNLISIYIRIKNRQSPIKPNYQAIADAVMLNVSFTKANTEKEKSILHQGGNKITTVFVLSSC